MSRGYCLPALLACAILFGTAVETCWADSGAKMQREAVANPFAKKSWRPPAPPPKAEPAVPQEAPPLQYSYFGRFVNDQGKLMVFLQKTDGRIFLVSSGDTLEGVYRIEEILGDSISLRYLPLGIMQTLRMNGDVS